MSRLYQELRAYGDSGIYPFHMPGHKRNMAGRFLGDAMKYDITETEDFDNLHEPEGVIRGAEERAAALYGSEETHYLVGGSTAGILSAVAGCVPAGGRILAARNCHKSVFNAVLLNYLNTAYLCPEMETGFGIHGGIFVSSVEKALQEYPDIRAVVITSPSYDGVVLDVASIAGAVHARNIPLIVDEAHGAHFGFHPDFPKGSVRAGADVVIHSLHKTLPAMTQTALIHLNGSLIDRERIRKYLSVYQSSSPSYLLMASMDQCVEILEKEGPELFGRLSGNLKRFRRRQEGLSHIRLADRQLAGKSGIFDYDPSRILISVRNSDMSGRRLYETLFRRFGIHLEMASYDYALAIAGIMDTEEGFERLSVALSAIDEELQFQEPEAEGGGFWHGPAALSRPVMKPAEADRAEKEKIPWDNSRGRISADSVWIYPPGIPLILPGERITDASKRQIDEAEAVGLAVQGLIREEWDGVVKKMIRAVREKAAES